MKEGVISILRYTEKFTKTDMVYLAKGSFWITLGQTSSMFAGFFLAIILSNTLDPKDLGIYKFVLSWLSIIAVTTLPGINMAFLRSAHKTKGAYFNKLSNVKFKWSLVGFLISASLSIYYFLNGNSVLGYAFLAGSALSAISESLSLSIFYLNGLSKFKQMSALTFSERFAILFLTASTLFFTRDIVYLILAYFISQSIVRLISTLLIRKQLQRDQVLDEDSSELLESISYGKKLSGIYLISLFAMHADKVLIFHFLGAKETAIYFIALIIPDQLRALSKNISSVVTPKLAEKDIKINSQFFRKMAILTTCLIFISIAYAAASPLIYKILFPKYIDSVLYTQIMSIIVIVSGVSILQAWLQVNKKTTEVYKTQIYYALLQIALFAYMIPAFGIMGAVVAKVVGLTFYLLITIYFSRYKS